jgi:hypothetical protein
MVSGHSLSIALAYRNQTIFPKAILVPLVETSKLFYCALDVNRDLVLRHILVL